MGAGWVWLDGGVPTAATASAPPPPDLAYDARHLQVLRGLDPVRKRPGMYISSTDGAGIAHLVAELVDNSADEAQDGHATRISVTLEPDGAIAVADDGRGIPVDPEPSTGIPGLQLVLSTLHAGGKFGGHIYRFSGGLHGVGVSVVCALASRLEARVQRPEGVFSVVFERGCLTQPLTQEGPPRARRHGTWIRFWPDPDIFGEAQPDLDAILERCRAKAYLIPGLCLQIQDLRSSPPRSWEFQAKQGMPQWLAELVPEPLHRPIQLQGEGDFEEQAQVLDEQGQISTQLLRRTGRVQLAMAWGAQDDTRLQLVVNGVPTPRGGSHLAGLNQALQRVVVRAVQDSRVRKARDPMPTTDDVLEGLGLVMHLQLPEPQFVGQAKQELGTPQAHPLVYQIVSRELGRWFEQAPRTQVRAIQQRVMAAARAREAARRTREQARRKSTPGLLALPAKLADCLQHYPAESELLVVEGDSAAGPAKAGRDQRFQAVLPIRGKILNAGRASSRSLADNTEVGAIFAALGPGAGQDPDTRRYTRVILMSDADADGHHIRCLLLSLLWHQARPLLHRGAVWVALPPLYAIKAPGRDDQYAYSDQQRDQLLAQAGPRALVSRFKGLGEMDTHQLRATCLDPAARQLLQVQVEDAARAARMFEQLMGQDAGARRSFIEQRSGMVDPLALDL